MLVRAARRKARHGAFRQLGPLPEPLFLPWLCPAQLRYQGQTCRAATITTKAVNVEARRDRNPTPLSSTGSRRSLATAVAEQQLTFEEYIPFEGLSSVYTQPGSGYHDWYGSKSLSDLKGFDPSNPVIINNSLATEARRIRAHDGVGGDATEIRMTLEACLRVGRVERASALVKRLGKIYAHDSKELLDAHNQYFRGAVTQIIRHRDEVALKAAQKWFEVEMRGRGVEPDATTYALLIKASLQTLQGPKAERTVRRYIDLASRSDHDNEVLNLPILTDAELFQVTRICPTNYYQADELVEASTHLSPDASTPSSTSTFHNSKVIPQVRPTEQKGLGLTALKKSLSIFSNPSALPYPDDLQGTKEENNRAFAQMRQRRLEQDAVDSAVERWREESESLRKIGMNSALKTKPISALMWEWHVAITSLLAEEMKLVDEAEAKDSKSRSRADQERCIYGPYLRFIPPEKLSAVTILAMMAAISTQGSNGVKLSHIVVYVGRSIQDEALAESIANHNDNDIWGDISANDRKQKLANLTKRGRLSDSFTKLVSGKDKQPLGTQTGLDRQWSSVLKAKVGAIMISLLIKAAKLPVTREHPETAEMMTQTQPAFYHSYQYKLGKKIGMLMGNLALVEQLKTEPVGGALAKHLPMIAEPKKWSNLHEGGFLQFPVKAMRVKSGNHDQQHYVKAATEKGDMDQVFAGLDVLAKTPWIINRAVFDIMLEAWNSGQAIASMPPERPDVVYPPEPDQSADNRLRQRWLRNIKLLENKKNGLHSQRCFLNFQLEVARAFLNETFYFPHNVDFRGRAYPIPPYLNHMGADNCRGLLMFGDGKELGSVGLMWLKVHLANVFGYDKASLKQREDFTMEHLQDVYDSATKPLNGNRWWLEAEDPWQCLAACIELRSALESPDPTTFVSHLPIHQDGTCNGLQHYAALGGDVWGAKQVNLEPGDKPADIYTAVAELVKEAIASEAVEGNEAAKYLDGKITRKVVKQTVMTNVYGVTWTGARSQVRKQLVDLIPNFQDTPTMNYGVLSSLVVRKIFSSLSTMFRGAHDIQYWLGECANRISQSLTVEQLDRLETEAKDKAMTALKPSKSAKSKSKVDTNHARFMSTVVWTTPLLMPVVQPYRTPTARSVLTNLQRVTIMEPGQADPISKRKQLQGFPPNFIHSLDATHMLLSALKCDEAGIAFAAVHDSFWTHAADVPTMNVILRDAFIRMHRDDIISRLAAEFETRHKGYMYSASVLADSPVGIKISNLRKNRNYKGRHTNELLMERKRLKLLQSADPKQQEEGRQMETPASIFEEAASVQDLAPADDLVEMGIGDIPKREAKLKADQMLEVGDEDNIETNEPVFDGADLMKNLAGITFDDEDNREIKQEPKRPRAKRKINIWLPLTFPPVPKKGNFDISVLKESQYFFS
ncbi:MAG: DNA-directed RNA polymerase [Candelina mexicana]|nr:MAG: DNA-directed RNA polymerase [Candelina mexicana]